MIQSGIFRAAFASPDRFYNRATRVIALEGPRGIILAHYLLPQVPPDPETQRYLVYYPDDYTPYKGTSVPQVANMAITATCVPIEVTSDTRMTVDSGAQSDEVVYSTNHGPRDFQVVTKGSTTLDANGFAVKENALDVHMGGAGMRVTPQGIHLRGSLYASHPETRGVTKQSPAWAILPKTAVTFWAADYLPDIGRLKKLAAFVLAMVQAVSVVTEVIRIFTDTIEEA